VAKITKQNEAYVRTKRNIFPLHWTPNAMKGRFALQRDVFRENDASILSDSFGGGDQSPITFRRQLSDR
jgi:hypothetical protein